MSIISQTQNAESKIINTHEQNEMLLKKPYQAPKITLITELQIENNLSGSGDGDAALAHS